MKAKFSSDGKYTIRIISLVLLFIMIFPTFASIAEVIYDPAENPDFDSYLNDSIPVIRIDTEDNRPITSKTVYKKASMSIENNEYFSDCKNSYTLGEGASIEVRGRGNSTWGVAETKVSMKIKLPKKESLFGMDASKHWYLLANYFDVTHLRNKLAYDLSATMGLFYTESTWAVVYLNGKYLGLYQVCEAIRVSEGCVDIFDWEETAEDVAYAIALRENLSKESADTLVSEMENDLSWVTTGKYKNYKISDYYDTSEFDITSGYLIEYDNRNDDDRTLIKTERYGIPLHLDNPERLDTNPEMLAFVTDLFNDFEDALASPTFYNEKGKHYSEYIDMKSFIDFWLIFNIFKNIEFGWLSIFLYVDNGKIYFAPVWDFDNGSGNQVTLKEDWMDTDSWFNIGGRARWWKMLSFDPNFISRAQTRYFELKEAIDDMLLSMDIYYKYIKAEAIKDYERIGSRNNWYINDSKTQGFDEEFDIMREWMYARIKWLDKQFALREPWIENRGLEADANIVIDITDSSSKKLPSDRITLYGAKADYLYTTEKTGDITVRVRFEDANDRSFSFFINGIRYTMKTTSGGSAEIKIPADVISSLSDPVAVFTVYYENGEDTLGNFATMRISEYENPTPDQVLVIFGADNYYINYGETTKAPEAPVEKSEMVFLGWTSDKKTVYAPGEEIPAPRRNVIYHPVWQRKDPFVFMESISYDLNKAPAGDIPVFEDTGDNGNDNSNTVYIVISVIAVIVIVAGAVTAVIIKKSRKTGKKL